MKMRLSHNINLRGWLSWGLLLVLVAALGALVPRGPLARGVYAATRRLVSWYTVHGYPGYLAMTGKHAVVRYLPGDRADAALVLAATEKYYGRVMSDFGVRPNNPVPVVVYPTAAALNKSFGWGDLDAMGAYWAGTVRVLAPSAWIGTASPVLDRDIFFAEGPMAHELTHLAVDDRTGGNGPRWLQEGLAQWEDRQLTGFKLPPPEGGTWYSFADLAGCFDSLTDQPTAYYQSLAAVTYMYRRFGAPKVNALLDLLRAGRSMEQALSGAFGENTAAFAVQYQKFATTNLDWW
jgi:hypothetical protein